MGGSASAVIGRDELAVGLGVSAKDVVDQALLCIHGGLAGDSGDLLGEIAREIAGNCLDGVNSGLDVETEDSEFLPVELCGEIRAGQGLIHSDQVSACDAHQLLVCMLQTVCGLEEVHRVEDR